MEGNQKYKIKRPLSHRQLLIFQNKSEYIMDEPNEYLKGPQRKEKFSIKELHRKWKRKINVNFKNIDKKFDTKKKYSTEKKKTEQDEIQDKEFFDLMHGVYYDKSSKRENIKIKITKNIYDKYNVKESYYLNTQIPWNNNSVFDIHDKKNNEKKILKNIKIAKKKNELINNKNINYMSLNERYIKSKYLITEVKNKFIKDKKEELYKKIIYINPEFQRYPEKIDALIFKEMINLFQEYASLIENKNNSKLSLKHNFKDEEIFDKLEILLAYLKEHKNEINQKEFLEPLISDYNKILEKAKYLKKIDFRYNKYIEENKRKKDYLIERRRKMLNIYKYTNNEKIEENKIKSIKTSNKEESKDSINNNKEINFFLSAYKSVIDEKKEREEKKKKEEKEKGISFIIKEKSSNPYRSLIKQKSKIENKDNNEEKNKIVKKAKSSYGTRQINITYYHPGNYFLFKEGDYEYNAWSCCLNENKLSKGCCKKTEKVLNFMYKY